MKVRVCAPATADAPLVAPFLARELISRCIVAARTNPSKGTSVITVQIILTAAKIEIVHRPRVDTRLSVELSTCETGV